MENVQVEQKNNIDRFAEALGDKVISVFEVMGSVFIFIWLMASRIPKLSKNPRLTVDQMSKIGITSLPLVVLTSLFTGAVVSWQAAYQFSDYIPLSYIGVAAGKAIMVNLGPVLTALVVAGRIGAAMAAELGTMTVTEQIEAMECLALDPFRFLFMPRFVATLIMLPMLVIISSFTGLMGAFLVAGLFFDLDIHIFFNGVRLFFLFKDVLIGLLKALVFGGIISSMGCYFGYYTTGGAEGVGESTKKSVVASSVWILVSGYIIDAIFL